MILCHCAAVSEPRADGHRPRATLVVPSPDPLGRCTDASSTSVSVSSKGMCSTLRKLKPNSQRKTELNSTQPNWTELDRSVQFSWVQFSFPLCIEPSTTCDDSATKLVVGAGSSLSRTCDGRRRSSPVQCIAENWTELNRTELNWTERSSSVQLSSVFRCALGFSQSKITQLGHSKWRPYAGHV